MSRSTKAAPVVFVDSLAAVQDAAERLPEARIVTDNPLLAHNPAVRDQIADISATLEQAEATMLGQAAVDMLMALDDRLIETDAARRFGGAADRLNLTFVMRKLLATAMQRGVMIKRALDALGPGSLTLAVVDLPRWEPSEPWSFPYFACPHRALAAHGFFGEREVSVTPVAAALPRAVNDTAIPEIGLRAALVPWSQLAFEAMKRLGLSRLAWRRGFVVGKPCETLREALPWLAFRMIRLTTFEAPPYAGPRAPDHGEAWPIDPWLADLARPGLLKGIAATACFATHEAHAIAALVLEHLMAGLSGLRNTRTRLDAALDAAIGRNRIAGLLTGGYYGPLGAELHAACSARGLPLIDFEHGATTGLALTSERRLRFSEATTCDALIASSPRAARSFAKAARDGRPRIHVAGLADQTRRVLRPRFQRRRARRRLGLARGEASILHVSTLIYGGSWRPGDDSPVESFVLDTDRTLLTEVYAGLGRTVLFKNYPARRYPSEAGYDALFALAPNLRLIEWADFRYVRAAADIIVTTANSSTIGWCAGAGAPLVHLGSRRAHALVDDELRDGFAAAFFTVDLDGPHWPVALRELLARPLPDLQAEWRRKAPARRTLLADAIFGPAGSVGRRAARKVMRDCA